MKKSVLITGVSGSGKSAVSKKLKDLGYTSYDIDSMKDVTLMVDKVTKQPTIYDNNNDVEKIEKMDWLYIKEKLAQHIENQTNNVAFYCGLPNNLDEILPLFSDIILLFANADTIRRRLIGRTGNDFGKSKQVQDWILHGKDQLEKDLIEKGALAVDANQGIELVVGAVLEKVRQYNKTENV